MSGIGARTARRCRLRVFVIIAVVASGTASANAKHVALHRGVGPAVRGVDGEECEHASQHSVLVFVRQVAVEGVHRCPEDHIWIAALAQRPASESLFEAVLASVASFPHDLEVVRRAATARTEIISADRIASHLRVVLSSFGGVITQFIKCRYDDRPGIDLVAEVAGAALAAVLVAAVENWGRSGCTGDLGELTAAAVNLVRSGLAPLS